MFREIARRKTQARAGNAKLISELNKVEITNLVRDNDGILQGDAGVVNLDFERGAESVEKPIGLS